MGQKGPLNRGLFGIEDGRQIGGNATGSNQLFLFQNKTGSIGHTADQNGHASQLIEKDLPAGGFQKVLNGMIEVFIGNLAGGQAQKSLIAIFEFFRLGLD